MSNLSWIVSSPIAHRGLFDNKEVAENSVSAFKECIKQGVPIELDVRPTKDRRIVVFHDDKLGRMTEFDGYVNNLDYAEFKDVKLLKTNDVVPLLEDVLKLVNGEVPILIEIKNVNGDHFEKEVYEAIKDYNGEVAIQSFNPLTLEWFKLNAPQIKRGQLASFFRGEKGLSFLKKCALKKLKLNKRAEPNFISYNIEDLPNKYVKKAGLPVVAWTVVSEDQKEKAKRVADNYIYQLEVFETKEK